METAVKPALKLEPDEVPDWSDETKAAFEPLTDLERRFVMWVAADCNSAEAYRRATGAEYTDRLTDSTRCNGYAIRSRPRVRSAIDAALKDTSFGPRMDREWILRRLNVALDKSEREGSGEACARILRIIAELKGEIVQNTQQTQNIHITVAPAAKRLAEALDLARKKSGVVVVSRAEAIEDTPEPSSG